MGNELAIKVMTFNIRHARGMDNRIDLEAVAHNIGEMDADIVALQEVDRHMPRSGFQDQAKRLGERLNMNVRFAPSLNFGFCQYGNAILSKFPILSHHVNILPGLWEKRSMLTARIKVHEHMLTVVNTHLGVLAGERSRQMSILLTRLNELAGTVLLMGDFNMHSGSSPMREITRKWKKLYQSVLSPTIHTGEEIDHILTNAVMKKFRVYTKQTRVSDHFPVLAELLFHPHIMPQSTAEA